MADSLLKWCREQIMGLREEGWAVSNHLGSEGCE
jgi:hypothetical protein